MNKLIKDLGINEKFTKVRIPQQKEFNQVKHNIPLEENINLMADLLFLPTTKDGYKYLFVIVDLATNKFDAIPIKNKEAKTTKEALVKVFETSDYIDGAKAIRTDEGTEFKGVFSKYLFGSQIVLKVFLQIGTNEGRPVAVATGLV